MVVSHEKLHLRDLLVDLLHELYYKVNELVLQHLLGVEVGDEKGDVISLARSAIDPRQWQDPASIRYLNSLPSQNEEGFGALSQEASELVDQDVLNLIGLLYPETYANTIDAGFYKDSLVLVARDN